MRAAIFFVPSLPYELLVMRQNAPDHRIGELANAENPQIGTHPTPPPPRQSGGPQEPLPVRFCQRHG